MKSYKIRCESDPRWHPSAEYVERIDRSPIETTPHRNLALIMGRFTAEDAVESIQSSRCSAEIVSVQVCV